MHTEAGAATSQGVRILRMTGGASIAARACPAKRFGYELELAATLWARRDINVEDALEQLRPAGLRLPRSLCDGKRPEP